MNIELLKSRVGTLKEKIADIEWNIRLDEQVVEDTIFKAYDVYRFYEKNKMPYEYDLEKMVDEIIQGFLKNIPELTEALLEINDLIEEADNLYFELMELEECEESEEAWDVLESLSVCQENLEFEPYTFSELDEYLENIQYAENIL